MAKQAKAPAGCFWRNGLIYGRIRIDGHLKRQCLDTDNKELAETRRAEWARKLTANFKYGEGPNTIAEMLPDWERAKRAEIGDLSVDRYLTSLTSIAQWIDGKTQSDLDHVLVARIVRERQKTGVTNATIKRDLTALSSVLKFAKGQGWRIDNPAKEMMDTFKERRGPMFIPHDDEIAVLIERAAITDRRGNARSPGMWDKLIAAAVITGARISELVKLAHRDLDFVSKKKTITFRHAKGNKTRVIDMAANGGVAFFRNLPKPPKGDLVFWHDDGEPYRNASSNFSNNVMTPALAWATANGVSLRKFTFHALRHKHGVDWLAAGGDIYDLQKRMGHATVTVTEGYLDCVTTEAERAARYGTRKAARQ